MNTIMQSSTWFRVSEFARRATGRAVIGTSGGDYVVTPQEICVPWGSTEGLVHELCHYAVATPQERSLLNFGLSQDWTSPGWDRNVLAEELAWSLEFYLYGDPSVDAMARLMTPEARASGGGRNITAGEVEDQRDEEDTDVDEEDSDVDEPAVRRTPKRAGKTPVRANSSSRLVSVDDVIAVAIVKQITTVRVTAAALAEMKRADELIYKGNTVTYDPQLREEALKLARRAGIPLDELRELLKADLVAKKLT